MRPGETDPATTCRELVRRIDDHVAGTLAPDDERSLRSHLHACQACARLVHSYTLTSELLRLVLLRDETPWPEALERRLLSALRGVARGPQR